MPLTLSSPLSLFSIPAIWALTYVAQVQKVSLLTKTIGYDNVQVRGNFKRLENDKVSRELAARVQRLEGIYLNGMEILPMWGLGILAGNYAGLDNWTLNVVSLAFFVTRIVYHQVYLNYNTIWHGALRTSVWLCGTSMTLFLLLKSATKVAAQ